MSENIANSIFGGTFSTPPVDALYVTVLLYYHHIFYRLLYNFLLYALKSVSETEKKS